MEYNKERLQKLAGLSEIKPVSSTATLSPDEIQWLHEKEEEFGVWEGWTPEGDPNIPIDITLVSEKNIMDEEYGSEDKSKDVSILNVIWLKLKRKIFVSNDFVGYPSKSAREDLYICALYAGEGDNGKEIKCIATDADDDEQAFGGIDKAGNYVKVYGEDEED